MTLFGRTLDGQDVAALLFMLSALVLWIAVYRGDRRWARWFRRREGGRKARREAELSTDKGDGRASPRGPWG